RRAGHRACPDRHQPPVRAHQRSRSGDSEGPPAADLRALLPSGRGLRLRARAGDREGVRRGERRQAARPVAARAGGDVRDRAATRATGGGGAEESPDVNNALKVLVVDDELQILRALRLVLREAGFAPVAAATASDALDAASLNPPDAAIIDLVLPDGDGVDVTAELRSWSEMPILVLSALDEEEEKIRALNAGADDYVTKPFSPGELVARLNAALRRARGV